MNVIVGLSPLAFAPNITTNYLVQAVSFFTAIEANECEEVVSLCLLSY
jgi:hypothetical protein